MNKVRSVVLVSMLLLAGCASASGPTPVPEPIAVTAGRRITERACGGCHATGVGPSRLADAPAFRDLHQRYGRGGLAALLEKGMLTPDVSLEEGVLPGHPRMPMVALTAGERADLVAFLRSLEP